MTEGRRTPVFGPLAGLRVVDFTVALSGAYSTMLLADLGAEVIKVESLQHYSSPTRGARAVARDADQIVLRAYPDMDPGADPWNRWSSFNSHARNKLAITLDVSRQRGRDLFLRLLQVSDGLIENNVAGRMEQLGLDPGSLLAGNTRLIVVRMPALGLSGPDHRTIGFGWHFEELGGALEVQGYPDGPPVGSIFMDASSGPAGASAFLMALIERERTGRGQVIELAQIENMINHYGEIVLEAAMTGSVPRRWGNRHPRCAPQGVYPCRGADTWVALSVRDDRDWAALRALVGDPPELRRPEFDTLAGRVAAHDEIDSAVSRWTRSHTKEEAFHALQKAGVPAGPVLDEEDAFADPHLQERGFFQLLEHQSAGVHFHAGPNFNMAATPLRVWRAAPVLGQDNDYVYREILGIDDDEYQDLVADGQIGSAYP